MVKKPTSTANSGESHVERKKPATLSDVARAAGVVAMTASRAINGSGYVSKEVRERVLEAAQTLNYRPNMLARYLKGQRLKAVGIMLPDIANPFSSELVNGIKDVLDQAGYTAFLALSGRGVAEERAGLQSLVDHRVDGLLVATLSTESGDEALREFSGQGIPLVTVGRPLEGVSVDCVTANHYQGAFDVVTHLIKMGHQKIGFIGISPEDGPRLQRWVGYSAAMKIGGLEVPKEYTVGPESAPSFGTQEDGFEGMMRLGKLRNRPTAVFARNDFAAMGALRAAHMLGLAIPQDIAIAGFDNIPLAAYSTPPLTTVEQPIREQGRMAAEILLERIEGTLTSPAKVHRLDCRVVVRESTDLGAR